jgi:hypothetical protein
MLRIGNARFDDVDDEDLEGGLIIPMGGPKMENMPGDGMLGPILGAGITEQAGRFSQRVIEQATDPAFLRIIYGDAPFKHTHDKRKALWDGRQIRNRPRPAGFTGTGENQYLGHMPPSLFKFLLWTDPTLFQDEKRLVATLKKMGTSA